jgi:type VI secretion system protein ImpK
MAFKLRGLSFNSLVDAANPLIGMALNAKKLNSLDEVEALYHRVRDEIVAIFEEVKLMKYDGPTQLSFRYCLCSFIDEAIMTSPWGGKSMWASQSMLAHFHNETWGGEKFFAILSRAMLESEKYQELLEFIYLCLSMGFKGQYSVDVKGNEKIQELLIKLNTMLRELRGEAPETLLDAVKIKRVNYQLSRSFPLWGIWAIALLVLVSVFVFYSISLDNYSDKALVHINQILEKWSLN